MAKDPKVVIDHDLVAGSASDSFDFGYDDKTTKTTKMSGLAKLALRARRLEVFEALTTARPVWFSFHEHILRIFLHPIFRRIICAEIFWLPQGCLDNEFTHGRERRYSLRYKSPFL